MSNSIVVQIKNLKKQFTIGSGYFTALRNTNLSHAHMYETEIRSAMLEGADLTNVRLKRHPMPSSVWLMPYAECYFIGRIVFLLH